MAANFRTRESFCEFMYVIENKEDRVVEVAGIEPVAEPLKSTIYSRLTPS
jgi:hypothetical protein